MTTSHKAALSLLISVLLFALFTVLSFTGLFNLIEASFYNPSVTSSITNDLADNANEIEKFIVEAQARFSETLAVPAIRRSFLPNQGAEDIFERSRIYGLLAETIRGLQWVRFIDSGGSRIHFSTSASDILQQDRLSVSYRNFDEPGFSYGIIAVEDRGMPKYTFDERGDRILFSFPFYDSFDVYRGTALFSLSAKAIADRLVSDGRIRVGQDLSIISDPNGILSGMSSQGERVLPAQVSSVWKEGWQRTARLTSPSSGLSLALITVQTERGFLVGRLVNEDMFLFPLPMKVILLISFFLTVYLTVFLLFNLRQDSVTIVQNRLKQLQISLIEQFYDRKGDVDWARWSRELEQRRDEINIQLKQGVKTSAVQDKDIDALIDKSWDELLSVIGGKRETGIDEEKLQVILNRILAALPASGVPLKVSPQIPIRQPVYAEANTAAGKEPEEVEALEELAEEVTDELVEEAEAVSEFEEVETLSGEEAEEVEEIEELEELVEEAEAVEEIAAAEEAEAVEVVEAVEETAAAAEADSAEVPIIDVADMDIPVETADEVVNNSGIDFGDEAEELEELDDLEALEEAEDHASEEAPQGISPQANSVIMDMDNLEELGSGTETDSHDDFSLEDFEIVSPFSTIDMGLTGSEDGLVYLNEDSTDENIFDAPATMVEEIPNSNSAEGPFLTSKPFFTVNGNERVENLEVVEGGDEIVPMLEDVSTDENSGHSVIEERGGVHYISEEALSPGEGANPDLNRDFKDLVDSVIK